MNNNVEYPPTLLHRVTVEKTMTWMHFRVQVKKHRHQACSTGWVVGYLWCINCRSV